MAYGGTAQAQVGRGTLMRRVICRASAITANTEAMKSSWPTSTPTLKNSSAMGIAFCGRPISDNAPAKPKPCSRPKVNATIHGYCSVSPGFPCRLWMMARSPEPADHKDHNDHDGRDENDHHQRPEEHPPSAVPHVRPIVRPGLLLRPGSR